MKANVKITFKMLTYTIKQANELTEMQILLLDITKNVSDLKYVM